MKRNKFNYQILVRHGGAGYTPFLYVLHSPESRYGYQHVLLDEKLCSITRKYWSCNRKYVYHPKD
jgi:hypothetical protein